MNLKITLKNSDGETVYCVVDEACPLQDELEKVFSIQKGYGLAVHVAGNKVSIDNYFRADTLATFAIISIKQTQEPLVYQLTAAQEASV